MGCGSATGTVEHDVPVARQEPLAAVDVQRLAVHAPRGHQERYRIGDVAGIDRATQQIIARDRMEFLRGLVAAGQRQAGRYRIDRNRGPSACASIVVAPASAILPAV